jgi:hypothetical protein
LETAPPGAVFVCPKKTVVGGDGIEPPTSCV